MSDTTLASGVAFSGKMRTILGFSDSAGREYFDDAVAVVSLLELSAPLLVPFDRVVLAIFRRCGLLVCKITKQLIEREQKRRCYSRNWKYLIKLIRDAHKHLQSK